MTPNPMSSQTQDTDTCGFEGTQSGEPCSNPATAEDGRCWFHTDGSEYRNESVMFRLRRDVHARLKAANTDDETLSDTVDRALDAMEYFSEDIESVVDGGEIAEQLEGGEGG